METSDITTSTVNKLLSDLDEPIKQIIETEGYVKYKVNKRSASSNNSNYLSLLYAVDIKGTTKDGEKETNLFVKCITPGDGLLRLLSIPDIFKTELFVYKELFKVYNEIQDEANIPSEERYQSVKFYESTSEAIIMENIAMKGFKTYYRMDVTSLQFAKLSVQELAKFYALSFAIKYKRPDYFNHKIKSLKNPIHYNEHWRSNVEAAKNLTIPFVQEEYKKKIEKEYDTLVNKYPTYFNIDTTTACLCHGDYRPSNTLAKMENGEVQSIINVDYQLVQYACPIYDFLYYIYFSTDREFRKAHLSELKNLYYETLSSFLKTLNVDPESVYPGEEFERAYEQKLDFGLAISLLFLVFMFVPEDGVADFKEIKFQTDDRFKERIRGVIEDYREWGYL